PTSRQLQDGRHGARHQYRAQGAGTAAGAMPGRGSALLAHRGQGLGQGKKKLSTNEQFQLSGEAAEHYQRCGAQYILGPCAPSLVNAARLSAGERVLDGACGPGVRTRIAADPVGPAGRLVGVDLNPGMLAVARSLPAPNGAAIEWLERSALDLGLEDASFDVVLCQQGLQFFPDKALALREMRRVLDRGGRLALSVWALIIKPPATRLLSSYRPRLPRASAP